MTGLEDIVGEDKVFRSAHEYRLGVSATVLAPCTAGVLHALAERFDVSAPLAPESWCWGTFAAAAVVMGYLFARRANSLLDSPDLPAVLRGTTSLLVGLACGSGYGAFAWVANQMGYWDAYLFAARL